MEFVLGATIGLFLAFFINIFTKISVHAVGMGGLIAMCIILIFEWSRSILPLQFSQSLWTVDFQLILLLSIILAGLVGMSRLALHAHTPADLYRGYVAGFAAVFIATSIL
jgi:membrane-associated phospholipid phosphatase